MPPPRSRPRSSHRIWTGSEGAGHLSDGSGSVPFYQPVPPYVRPPIARSREQRDRPMCLAGWRSRTTRSTCPNRGRATCGTGSLQAEAGTMPPVRRSDRRDVRSFWVTSHSRSKPDPCSNFRVRPFSVTVRTTCSDAPPGSRASFSIDTVTSAPIRPIRCAMTLSGHTIRIVRQRPVRRDAGGLPASGARRRARAAGARAARLADGGRGADGDASRWNRRRTLGRSAAGAAR